MPSLGTVIFTGKSGREYTFTIYALDAAFNAFGAVYCFMRDEGTNHHLVYIGQTGDLSERFNGHHQAACIAQHHANRICVYRENNELARLWVESDLLAKLTTTCNG